jgi:integrase
MKRSKWGISFRCRDRAVVYLLTYAGLRVKELSNLKLTDLDLEMKQIRIVGKGMKVRTVPIFNILFLVGRTRGLASVSRGNGEKETACGCVAICFL